MFQSSLISPSMGSEPNTPTSLKKKLIKSPLCISCCFRRFNNRYHRHHRHQVHDDNLNSPKSPQGLITRSSSASGKSRHHEMPELKEKCRNLISCIGGGGGGGVVRHSRRHSADFHYDALSYSLNFDHGCDGAYLDEYPLRDFSARLPVSPPSTDSPSSSSSSRREIVAFT